MFLNFNYLKSTFTEYKETLELIKQNNWRKYFWINFNFINSRGFFNNIINEYIRYNRENNIIEGNKFTKIEKNILLNLIKEIELLSEEILFGELINFKKNNTILFEREVRNEANNKLIKRTTGKNKAKIFLYTFLTILIIAVVIIIFIAIF
ncbi:hypothetical protein NWQ33_00560 [Mycoplasmopsis cynos]|nr:hypothetical protein [Mycoplasmopsis cynos]